LHSPLRLGAPNSPECVSTNLHPQDGLYDSAFKVEKRVISRPNTTYRSAHEPLRPDNAELQSQQHRCSHGISTCSCFLRNISTALFFSTIRAMVRDIELDDTSDFVQNNSPIEWKNRSECSEFKRSCPSVYIFTIFVDSCHKPYCLMFI
jgi:hypothetical protein